MKNIVYLVLFIAGNSCGQTYTVKAIGNADLTNTIQAAFNNSATKTIMINTPDVVINGSVTIPEGKVLKIEHGFKVSGKGTITGGSIDADYQSQVFDTTLTVNPKSVNQYFSVKWFGAKGNNTDDYYAIQKTINTCIRNNIRTVYFPVGRYQISKPLIIRGSTGLLAKDNNNENGRAFCTVELLGESSFWDNNMGSEIIPMFRNTFAIGIQNGKGCKIRKLTILGLFTPPKFAGKQEFYSSSFEDFKDGESRDSRYSPYAAIVIDPFTNLSTDKLPADGGYPGLQNFYGKSGKLGSLSGSTATELEELSISGFVTGICSSPNGTTRNAEITIINKVQFRNCKLCISGGQDQEKGNVVSNIHCWGGTHTIFATGLYGSLRMAGNWNIDHANIAGNVVRFMYNDQPGYFPTYVSHVFAESLGSFGTLNSQLACEVSDCIFNFAYQKDAGVQTILTSWGENVLFRSCNFRYYGEKTPLVMEGNCVFEHCFFSGPLNKSRSGPLQNFLKITEPDFENIFFKASIIVIILSGLIILLFLTKRIPLKRYSA